jgi:hypothetical protein
MGGLRCPVPNASFGNANVDGRNASTSRIDSCIHRLVEAYYLATSAVPRGSNRPWRSHQRTENVGVLPAASAASATETNTVGVLPEHVDRVPDCPTKSVPIGSSARSNSVTSCLGAAVSLTDLTEGPNDVLVTCPRVWCRVLPESATRLYRSMWC